MAVHEPQCTVYAVLAHSMCVSRPADPFRSALIMCISSRANHCKKALYRCSFYYNHKWTHWILVRLISVKLKKSIIINWTLPRLDAIIAICHSIEQKTFRWILRNRTKEKMATHLIVRWIEYERHILSCSGFRSYRFVVRLMTTDTAFDCLKSLCFIRLNLSAASRTVQWSPFETVLIMEN